jgi:hypothetical protein
MTSLVLEDLILESLTPSVNAPLVKFSLIYKVNLVHKDIHIYLSHRFSLV